MSQTFWKKTSPLNKRILTIAVIFAVITIITGLAMITPMSDQEAVDTNNKINQTVQSLRANDTLLQDIYGNNFYLTMLMFIPFIGPFLGFYIFYNTGVVLEAEAIAQGYSPSLVFVSLFINPIFWLEFAAYSIAIASSIWLSARLVQKGSKHEIMNTVKFISVCAVILLVSAVVETALIYAGA